MRYELFISEEALEQVRKLPESVRRNIGDRLELLQKELGRGMTDLEGESDIYRVDVGTYQVRFRLDASKIDVCSVLKRKDSEEPF